jgi:hypothetical protein
MDPGTRARWAAAWTLRELGELTALWLEGRLASQPGYMPNCGPDEETTPLAAVLAHANRAGFVTESSQPGEGEEVGYDGAVWTQRAAVEGRIEPSHAAGLIDAARASGLVVITHRVGRRFTRRSSTSIDVTRRNGRTMTWFGRQLFRGDLETLYPECNQLAFAQLVGAVQLAIAAPEYGPHDRLWQVLADWSTSRHTTVASAPAKEPLSYPQLLVELDTIHADAAAEVEDLSAALDRARDATARIDRMLAALTQLELDRDSLAHLTAIADTNTTTLDNVARLLANAEHRWAVASDALAHVRVTHHRLYEAHQTIGRDAARREFYQPI